MDMSKVKAKAKEHAEVASSIETKLRNLLVDEVEATDLEPEEELAMAVLVSLGMATTVLKQMIETVGPHKHLFQAVILAINFHADHSLGPQLVKLHKLGKEVGI